MKGDYKYSPVDVDGNPVDATSLTEAFVVVATPVAAEVRTTLSLIAVNLLNIG